MRELLLGAAVGLGLGAVLVNCSQNEDIAQLQKRVAAIEKRLPQAPSGVTK